MQKILLSPDPVELAAKIRQWAGELGFGQVGFSRPDLGEHGRHLQHWLARGFHGDMTYMAAHGEKRWQPASLVEGTRSLISVRMDYLVEPPPRRKVPCEPEMAVVSRYARVAAIITRRCASGCSNWPTVSRLWPPAAATVSLSTPGRCWNAPLPTKPAWAGLARTPC
jgi:hypothetical protein